MSADLKPTCSILQQFSDDLKIAGFSKRTQESYCRELRKSPNYIGQSLGNLEAYVFRFAIANHRIAKFTQHGDDTGELIILGRLRCETEISA